MVAMLLDSELERRMIRRRRRTGADRHDEVWDGVYVMAPAADNQHQFLASDLNTIFQINIDWAGLGRCAATVNISDREEDWKTNFRVPDLAVFMKGNTAVEHRAFWFGGPDFGVEIASPDDRTDDKLPFYEAVRTRELLIIDRKPWALRLYRLTDGSLGLVARSTPDAPAVLRSEVIPLSFDLTEVDGKTALRVIHNSGAPSWTVLPRDLPSRKTPDRRTN